MAVIGMRALHLITAGVFWSGLGSRIVMKLRLDGALPPEKQPSWLDREPSLVATYEDIFPGSVLPLVYRASFWLALAGIAAIVFGETPRLR